MENHLGKLCYHPSPFLFCSRRGLDCNPRFLVSVTTCWKKFNFLPYLYYFDSRYNSPSRLSHCCSPLNIQLDDLVFKSCFFFIIKSSKHQNGSRRSHHPWNSNHSKLIATPLSQLSNDVQENCESTSVPDS